MRNLLLAMALTLLSAGCVYFPDSTAQADISPEHGPVTDLGEFHLFIAAKPTPTQFRARYPDVLLILPGDVTTREFRIHNSRYFAQLNEAGLIVGGKFM